MKNLLTSFTFMLLISCTDMQAVKSSNGTYTSFQDGQTFTLQKDVSIVEYDYLQVPLVKPGIQLLEVKNERDLPEYIKGKITGQLKKGDRVQINNFVIEGGWIPCKGDWFIVNPIIKVLSGESKGKEVGISFLIKRRREKSVEYKSGNLIYTEIDPNYLRLEN
jgi:hypothetical protein